MAEPIQKRATIYFDPALHRALKLKAAEAERSVSELVNEAVQAALAEDAADFEAVAGEPRPRSAQTLRAGSVQDSPGALSHTLLGRG